MRTKMYRTKKVTVILFAMLAIGGISFGIQAEAYESWQDEMLEDEQWQNAFEIYEDVLSTYVTGLEENWNMDQFMSEGFCEMFADNTNLEENGFYLEDIDTDGTPELFVGMIPEVGDGMFYDLYTIVNEEPCLIASSKYRDRRYLLNNGTINETGSLGAAQSAYGYYYLEGAQLVLSEALLFDASYNSENPWFYSTDQMWADHRQNIDEDEAMEILDSYAEMQIDIPYLSFADYAGEDIYYDDGTESWEEAAYPTSTIISVTASSELYEDYMYTLHGAKNVLDGDLTTGWTEDVPGQGYGEYLTFMFDESYPISGIIIYAGFQKNEDLYYKNSRPLTMTAMFDDGSTQVMNLEDVFGEQTIYFDYPVDTSSVELTIDSVYPGWKYEDTVISELRFF